MPKITHLQHPRGLIGDCGHGLCIPRWLRVVYGLRRLGVYVGIYATIGVVTKGDTCTGQSGAPGSSTKGLPSKMSGI